MEKDVIITTPVNVQEPIGEVVAVDEIMTISDDEPNGVIIEKVEGK